MDVHKQALEIFDHIDQLIKERDEYKRLAESWMKDYDELKAKYESLILVESEK